MSERSDIIQLFNIVKETEGTLSSEIRPEFLIMQFLKGGTLLYITMLTITL